MIIGAQFVVGWSFIVGFFTDFEFVSYDDEKSKFWSGIRTQLVGMFVLVIGLFMKSDD